MIAIVHSLCAQSVHAPALSAGLMDNDAERYCRCNHKHQLHKSHNTHCDYYCTEYKLTDYLNKNKYMY